MAVSPLKTSSEELEKENVIEILTNPPMESVIVPPFRPKEGEIYLYDASSKPDDWRCDGYRWYQNGIKNIPRKNPVIKKTYFILKTPTGTSNNFKRQKCSKSCHKGKRCTNTEGQVSTDDAIEISDLTPSPKKFKHTNTWLDIENYTLTIDDRDSITNGEWLNDNHINAAQSLLKTKFPNAHVQGLQHANYATTLTFEVVSLDCVQIINMCKNHWITLSTFGCNVSEVNICDSLYSHLDSFTNKIIASLLSTSDKSITVNHIDVQRQSNTSDCGVLAIAFATAICHGIDLTTVSFDHQQLRPHLLHCLQNKEMINFPVKRYLRNLSKIRSTVQLEVHCVCQMPAEKEMAHCDRCRMWFHKDCVDDIKGTEWKCSLCA